MVDDICCLSSLVRLQSVFKASSGRVIRLVAYFVKTKMTDCEETVIGKRDGGWKGLSFWSGAHTESATKQA